MPASTIAARQPTLLQGLMRERHLTREQTVELLDRRARSMGIRDFALSLRQLDRWLGGHLVTEPRPSVCRVVEAEFGRSIQDLLSSAEAASSRLAPRAKSGAGSSLDRTLRTLDFVAWVAEHSSLSFEDVYEAVSEIAVSLEAEPFVRRVVADHKRSKVGRQQIAEALGAYYRWPSGMYGVSLDRRNMTSTLLTMEGWIGMDLALTRDEPLHALVDECGEAIRLCDAGVRGAVTRLARMELVDTVLVDQPIYQLSGVDLAPGRMGLRFGLADFAAYALTSDLLEEELLDSIVIADGPMPLREVYLPDVATVSAFSTRVCAGGPACLVAIARPAGDYALLVQERSRRVVNVAGRLAVIPKGFHQPTVDPLAETRVVATVERELEEELLGRIDLDQLSRQAERRAAPIHALNRSAPMEWLASHPDSYEMVCTGFGINLVTGNYELACVVVIDDVAWWQAYGHLVEANWEAARLHCISSRDRGGLSRLAVDDRWSNEGLFAFLEGMRWLESHDPSRMALPELHVSLS